MILAVLAEGNSIASTARITGADDEAILRLLKDIAAVCRATHDMRIRKLTCRVIEADELWSFVYKKEKRTTPADKAHRRGDAWLWLATDIDTKLIVSYLVADRTLVSATSFMRDLASRLTHRVQLNSDGLLAYVDSVESAFGSDVDFVQAGAIMNGSPDMDCAVTSHVERLNLTIRMHDRRFTRKTNAFSKRIENHAASVDFHVLYYNFIRVHMSLSVTPAMEAGIADHIWTYEELVELLEQRERDALDAPLAKFRRLRERAGSG